MVRYISFACMVLALFATTATLPAYGDSLVYGPDLLPDARHLLTPVFDSWYLTYETQATPRGPFVSPYIMPPNPLADNTPPKLITAYDQRLFNNPFRSVYNTSFYSNMTREKIRNMTLLEKMWRNIDGGNNLEIAYMGETSAPDYIAPYSRPLSVIKPFNKTNVYEDTLHMTVPSQTDIDPVFWQTWQPRLGERKV